MLGAVAVGGTLAYLTDNETATNTITVGDVKVDLIEPTWPGNDSNDVKLVVPTEEVTKDPQVLNSGTSEAIVFMTVEVPKAAVGTIDIDGTNYVEADDNAKKEVVYFKLADSLQTDLENDFNDGVDDATTITGDPNGTWIQLDHITTEEDKNTYLFAYNVALPAGKQTEPLFQKIQLINAVNDSDFAVDGASIGVTAYAIQSTNINGKETINMSSTTDLKAVYDILVKQEKAKSATLKDANSNNTKNLSGDGPAVTP